MQRGLWKLQLNNRAFGEGKIAWLPWGRHWDSIAFSVQKQISARDKECIYQHSARKLDRRNCEQSTYHLCSCHKEASKAEDSNSNHQATGLLWDFHWLSMDSLNMISNASLNWGMEESRQVFSNLSNHQNLQNIFETVCIYTCQFVKDLCQRYFSKKGFCS